MPSRINGRSTWNARSPASSPTETTWAARTGFMVHHSAGPATQSIRAIQDFHMDTRGWNDIGYNYLINASGIYLGRGALVIGAHAAGHNTANIGVCLIGDYSNTEPSHTLKNHLQVLYSIMNSMAGKTLAVRTHRQVNPTACPGTRLHNWVLGNLDGNPGDDDPGDDNPANWLEDLIMSLPTLRRGSSGASVRRVQGLCVAYGGTPRREVENSGGVDGSFGPGTERAVRAVQADGAPPVDGIVGRITWTKLIAG
ncbi:peptidoglycan recognition protein family protein [Natronoglycomyces albus]|uniref:N-acetylmuramoyl-L-alanine amidase n=1 Tax=Natronoglycomyces albus TaxID=2811108 RepID=A0A895XPX2_9ACTN|nr:peptidoglycan-binding domain-containing protein [Natronoglycomyces albus]QSB05419.1 N-acetylmuramoyl-L-alanine amidase [Natronoglycomyces albus]